MKSILCFGDSNTWGYDPRTGDRYPIGVRWTSLLQAGLPDCRVLEGGLNGRTASVRDVLEPGRCGLDILPIALKTHDPLDLVVLMLGTNDVKTRYAMRAPDIAKGVEMLVRQVQNADYFGLRSHPGVLVVAPPPLEPAAIARDEAESSFTSATVAVSEALSGALAGLCARMDVPFFDAGRVTRMGEVDGVHLSPEGHARLAEALLPVIRGLL